MMSAPFTLSKEKIMAAFDKALLPSPEEVKAYHDNGYYISKRIYSDQEIEKAIQAQDAFYAGARDNDFAIRYKIQDWGWKPSDGDVLRKTDYSCLSNTILNSIVTKPLLSAIAATLAGVPEIRLWHDQLLYKPGADPAKPAGNKSNVGWHTDLGYWMTCSSDKMLTAWVAFQDTGEDNGTVTMIKGSQHWPLSEGLNFFDGDLESMEKNFNTGGNAIVKVPMLIPKGCASFHHCKIIHGSGPNKTPHSRRSMAIHMQPGENHYRVWKDKEGKIATHANDHLVQKIDGQPDYADSQVCPRLYPAA
jgi:ectoine hydroxylase-related dioxygenase (phytanoyl-CoA dioxygenase family)